MSNSSPNHSVLINESLRQRFEASWVAGTPGSLSECLPEADSSEFLPTLEELVHIQLEFSWKVQTADEQRPVTVRDLLTEFPVLGKEDVLLRLLRQEYHCRQRAGDTPSVDDYQESFPDLNLDPLTVPPGETVGPKASDDTASESIPDDQATLPLSGAASPVSVSDDVPLNAAVTAVRRTDDQTLATSSDSPEGASLHDDTTIAGEASPAISNADDNSVDTINTETSNSQIVFAPGKQVPGYELLGELGRGGMGVVYRALDTRLKRVVALKMILSGAHAGEQDLRRFQKEAEAVAQLQHPGIVQIHDVGEHDGQPFLSLEFVEGGGLDEKIGGEPQPPSEAAAMVEELARAVHFAHEGNIVHRDLKPANVLMTAEGKPKITDFGLAKRLEEDASQTASGSIMGTPSYMAPEQAGDKKNDIGPHTDVYALGAILYCMLTGRPPFQSSSVMDTVMQVLEQEPVTPSQLVKGLDKNIETITLKCLQKSPSKRYQTALDLAVELGRFRNGEPIQARPVGVGERAWRWGKRNPLGATVLFLMIALGVGGPFMAIRQTLTTRALWDQSYISDMALTRLAFEEANIPRVKELLSRSKDSPQLRGFEWRYWARKSAEEDVTVRFSSGTDNRIGWIDFVEQGKGLIVSEYQGNTTPQVELANLRGPQRHANPFNIETSVRVGSGIPLAYSSSLNEILLASRGIREGEITKHSLKPLFERKSTDDMARPFAGAASADRKKSAWPGDRGSLKLHDGMVRCAAYSSDGSFACSGGDDRLIKLWRTSAPDEVTTLKGHGGRINSVVFDPQNKRLASCSSDSTVRIWSIPEGKPLFTFNAHERWVRVICFSPDGKRVLSAGDDGNLYLWDSDNGQILHTLVPDRTMIGSLAISPDGSRIATGTLGGLVSIWSTATWKRIVDLRGHGDSITCLRFDPRGRWLASGSDDGLVKLWHANPVSLTRSLFKSGLPIAAVGFSPDGSQIASCGFDGIVRIADVQSRQPTLLSRKFGGRHFALEFTPNDSSVVLSTKRDGSVFFDAFDAKTGRRNESVRVRQSIPTGKFSMGADGSRVAVGRNDTFVIYDTKTGKELAQGNKRLQNLRDIDFNGNNDLVGIASTAVTLFNAQTGEFLRECEHSRRSGPSWSAVAFSGPSDIVVAGSSDGWIGIWNVKNGRLLLRLKRHRGFITDVSVSPDGSRVASCGRDGTVRLLETATGQEVLMLRGHTGPVNCVAFRPDGNMLASGGHDGLVKIWDARPWGVDQKVQSVARNVVNLHSLGKIAKTDFLESISNDPLITESVRKAALENGTRRWDMRIEFVARIALDNQLTSEGLFVDEAVQRISSDKRLSEEIRSRVRTLAKTATENDAALNNVSWLVVRRPDAEPKAYQRALLQIRRAVELQPQKGIYVNTLGVAQYRVGEYEACIKTLKQSMDLNYKATGRPVISDLVFVAMAHFRAGSSEEATKAVGVARRFIRSAKRMISSEDTAFAAEMEALFGDKFGAPPQ